MNVASFWRRASWVGLTMITATALAACGSSPQAGSASTATQTVAQTPTTTNSPTPTTTTQPTVAIADLPALAEKANIPPNGLSGVGGVLEDDHTELYALTEVCGLRLLADDRIYVDHYRYWRMARSGYTMKNLTYAYQKTTAAEAINELTAALTSCHRWTEVDDTERVVVRDVAVDQPGGLSAFLAFCQDSPTGARRFACVAYLGHGNVVTRVSVARPDYRSAPTVEALRAVLPHAAQALLT